MPRRDWKWKWLWWGRWCADTRAEAWLPVASPFDQHRLEMKLSIGGGKGRHK